MSVPGKKINELNQISALTNETVFPALFISGQITGSDAEKVTIAQLKNNLNNDFYTKEESNLLLGNKQDTLSAGKNISINNSEISSPNSVQSLQVATILPIKETDYNNLVEKDPTVFYLILEDESD